MQYDFIDKVLKRSSKENVFVTLKKSTQWDFIEVNILKYFLKENCLLVTFFLDVSIMKNKMFK